MMLVGDFSIWNLIVLVPDVSGNNWESICNVAFLFYYFNTELENFVWEK
jgi:hypothetical protein